MVNVTKNALILVMSPAATNRLNRNSLSAAAHAKITAFGNPMSATPLMNFSDGGSFPNPCEKAIIRPA